MFNIESYDIDQVLVGNHYDYHVNGLIRFGGHYYRFEIDNKTRSIAEDADAVDEVIQDFFIEVYRPTPDLIDDAYYEKLSDGYNKLYGAFNDVNIPYYYKILRYNNPEHLKHVLLAERSFRNLVGWHWCYHPSVGRRNAGRVPKIGWHDRFKEVYKVPPELYKSKSEEELYTHIGYCKNDFKKSFIRTDIE